MLSITQYPNKILRQKALTVKQITDPKFQDFIEEMKIAMVEHDGVGLAANQVDSNQRVLVVSFKEGPKAFINPVVFWKNFFNTSIAEEGCLSFPNVFGLVKRPIKVWLWYFNEQGKFRLMKAEGLLARILQHEIDHLNGVLFIDKMIKYTSGEDKIKKLIAEAKPDEK